MKLDIINQKGEKTGQEEVKLPKFSNIDLKKIILAQTFNQHRHLASAKNRSAVAGSLSKPWRQKGTGRARAGSKKSPLWIGGGVTFAPTPGKKIKKINKKENSLAKKTFIYKKIKNNDIVLINKIELKKANTKAIATLLKKIEYNNKKILLINAKPDKTLSLSCRNIPNLLCKTAENINILDLAKHQKIILEKSALKTLL